MGNSSTITLSLCSEQNPEWTTYVSVPVTVDAHGAIQVPLAAALMQPERQAELTELTGSDKLFSVRKEFDGGTAVTTYLPLRDVHFQLGKAVPVDPAELSSNVKLLADKLRMMIDGTYRCMKWQQTQPTVYVVGHTDTTGSAEKNQQLSKRRAVAIARAMKTELGDVNVRICSTGVGEAQAGTADDVPFPEARRAKVMVTSEGAPFSARWRCLQAGRKKP